MVATPSVGLRTAVRRSQRDGGAFRHEPVTPGSIWAAGPHRFVCADVLDAHATGVLGRHVPRVDALYTDPPWDDRVLREFHRRAGIPQTRTWQEFTAGLLAMCRDRRPAWTILEVGQRGLAALTTEVSRHGGEVAWVVRATYGPRRVPCSALCVTFGGVGPPEQPPSDLHGSDCIRGIMRCIVGQGSAYFDPCAGSLTYCRAALAAGAGAVYGCELIPDKLARGLVWFDKHVGNVERIE